LDLIEFFFESGEKIVEFGEFIGGSLEGGKVKEEISDGFGDESWS
jgi:hypothetical protein